MKNHILMGIVINLFFLSLIGAENKKELDRVMNSYVDNDHKKEFSGYYKKFVKQHTKKSVTYRKTELRKLQEQGRAALQMKFPHMLKASGGWSQQNTSRLFTRCGVYERFLQEKATERLTMWYKIRCYADATKRRVVHGFNKIKSRCWGVA